MTYDYLCPKCASEREVSHPMAEDPIIKCEQCPDGVMHKTVKSMNFMIKGDTSTKLWKEERFRNKKNADLGVKQLERYSAGSKLMPNIGGTEFDSWADAKKAAGESGMVTSSFDSYVEKEKVTKNSDGVDENRWKTAKEVKAKA